LSFDLPNNIENIPGNYMLGQRFIPGWQMQISKIKVHLQQEKF